MTSNAVKKRQAVEAEFARRSLINSLYATERSGGTGRPGSEHRSGCKRRKKKVIKIKLTKKI